jgi:hypothetical protein
MNGVVWVDQNTLMVMGNSLVPFKKQDNGHLNMGIFANGLELQTQQEKNVEDDWYDLIEAKHSEVF